LLCWVDGWVGVVVDGFGYGEVAWEVLVVDERFVVRLSVLTWSLNGVRDSLWWWHCGEGSNVVPLDI
jgi:hypothetical protein